MARTHVEELDLDAFLGHSGSSGGGTFLKNWKEAGRIDVWLHPRAKIVPLWSHNWYTIGKDRETKDPALRTYRVVSLEREAVLKHRYRRNDDGMREHPPEICPFSKLLEWVHQSILKGAIRWTDEIFVFDEVPKESLVIHAGGFTGMFNSKDLEPTELAELRRAGIRRDDAWKEAAHARMQYIFRIVKNGAPEEGCLIALESQALGDKVKRVIADRIDDAGREKGDPFKNPYAFRWVYDDDKDFSNKYEARSMLSFEVSPELQAVFDAEPPSINELTRAPNLRELRASFEAHWVHKDVVPPWAELFAAAEAEYGETVEEAPDDRPEELVTGDDDQVECDVCKSLMAATEYTCPTCGTVYDEKTGVITTRGVWPKPEPEPTRRGRKGSK
jgi:hypothetical protein